MSNPQQPELRRSGETPSMTPDSIAGELKAHDRPTPSGTDGHPVPEANQAGTPSGPVQDKPDLDKFAAKLGAKKDAAAEADRSEDAPKSSAKKRPIKRAASAVSAAKDAGSKVAAKTGAGATHMAGDDAGRSSGHPLVAVGVKAVGVLERPIVRGARLVSTGAGAVRSAADLVAGAAGRLADRVDRSGPGNG